MVGRLPETWIPPDDLLDLRARVRLRHALVNQRGEWQQRIHSVLYHHGDPQRRDLLRRENRAWVEQAALPATAREQITVALALIDVLYVQVAPIDRALRAYARRQAGCRALMTHYGIGALVSIVILAELGDCRRFSSSREAVRYAGLDITVHQSDPRARAPLAPGATGAALGATRGRAAGTTHDQPRPGTRQRLTFVCVLPRPRRHGQRSDGFRLCSSTRGAARGRPALTPRDR
jgi:transposase